jgi:cytochrome c-type biogenesis protein CcmH/NrfF
MLTSKRLRLLSWSLMVVTFIVALLIGILDNSGEETPADRATALAATIACPQCSGQPVSESNAPIAEVIRAEIKNQVDLGLTDSEIRAFYRTQYGDWVDLRPSNDGIEVLIWVSPFLLAGVALGGMTLVFSRKKSFHEGNELSDESEDLVEGLRASYETGLLQGNVDE